MNTFCVLPWMQVSVKPAGAMTTCCVMKALSKNKQDSNNVKFDNRDIIKHVREKYDEMDGFVDTLSFFKE